MRILFLSLDQALIHQGREGDTLERLNIYKNFCTSMTVIVPTHKKFPIKNSKGLKIIPAAGTNNFFSYCLIIHIITSTLAEELSNYFMLKKPAKI